MNVFAIRTPGHGATHADRVEWLGERLWDFAEGTIDRETAQAIYTIAVGWADLGSENERRELVTLAGRLRELYDG